MTWLKKPADTIIRFSSYSKKEISAHQVQSYNGKFKPEHLSEKGQLFVLAAGIDGYTTEQEAKAIVVRVIREVYYSDPSGDIVTSLKNAFKDANKLVNEIFREQADTTHLGIACTSLVLTSERIYVAQVGDSSTYRITRQKLENVTARKHERLPLLKKDLPSKRPETELALGIGAEIDPEVHDIPLRSGDCFLLCSDRLIDVGVEEIRQIVRSNTPRQACQKLVDSARHLGLIEQADVQVLWVSSIQPTPDSSGGKLAKIPVFTKATVISVGAALLLTAAFFQTVNLEKLFPEHTNAPEPSSVDPDPEASRHRAEAAAFFNAGELDMALSKYRALQAENPTDSLAATRIQEIFKAYKDKAHLYYQNGYYSAALTYYQKAFTLEPENSELANLIAACEKKLTGISDESSDTVKKGTQPEPTANRVTKKKASKRSASGSDASTENPEQRPRLWNWSTLLENDAEVKNGKIHFLKSATRKRLLSQIGMTNFEFQFTTTVAETSRGRFGVIVGYQTRQHPPYETFYLISFYPEKEFILQRYTNFKKDILATSTADSPIEKKDFSFRVVCNAADMAFYYDDKLIFDWEAPEPIVGRIGLYAGPDTDVTFSNMKLTENK